MAKLIVPSEEDSPIVMGGVLGALTLPGHPVDPTQRAVINAFTAAFGKGRTVAELQPLSPAEVAAAIKSPEQRHQLAHIVIALELIAHPLSPEVETHAETYLRALGVEDEHLRLCRDTARSHLLLLHADLMRQSWTTETTVREIFHEGKLEELARSKLAYYGIGRDATVARRWESLRDCPHGSWGRTVADFYEVHDFPFPGEPHGIYEVGAAHDWVHVLCDYATTPEGEIDVFAFIAVASDDPTAFVNFAFTLALFQNASIDTVGGKRVSIARSDTLADPGAASRLAGTLVRANEATADVLAVDHFALKDLPLHEARERFTIVDKALPGPGWKD